jgi:hypothetical protein
MLPVTTEDIGHVFKRIILDTERGCWELPGSQTDQDYRNVTLHDKTYQAHRLFYTWFHGPILPHNDVHHMCNTKSCIKPAHLQAVPHRLNVLLIEQHVILRTERLKNLLEASLALELHGTARFTSHRLKEILGCRTDNGKDIVTVLQSMHMVYPGQFSFKHVGKGRRQPKGRPMYLYEISMDESLRKELLPEDSDHDENMALLDNGHVADLNSLSAALMM